ncbi:hypothetical protein GCM10023330_15710 [Litoribaculum gwangyangense]|uniref:VWFA domain-containing protein n=2 Tax=Litoribaculum gwangyangense TaxID=1130722 RepID=A0ABP9CKL2_9FLAO
MLGCKDKSVTLKKGTGKPPFSVWEEIIDALEKSPDNLIGMRKNLVLQKDPKAIVEFVRNGFKLVPRTTDFLHDISRHSQYGIHAAMRSGLSTPREKAEILKDMLVEAGFEANVVVEQTQITIDEAKAIVFNSDSPIFNPPISDKKIKEWHKTLELESEGTHFNEIPNAITQANQFADSLLNQLDEKYIRNSPVHFRFDAANIPSVVFKENGEEKYAHIFDPKVPYGSLHPTNKNQSFKEAPALNSIKDDDITITLSCRNALDNWNETELIKGSWKASQLIGNQVKLQFLNNMSLNDMATQSISQISSFTPCLALQDLYKDTKNLEEHSFLGEPITLEGERLLQNSNFVQNVDNTEKGNPKDVVSLDANIEPKAFPKVRVTLFPKDSNGNIVENLGAKNFKITDNGRVVTGWLQQNKIVPRVLLMYDTSLSMPEAYRGEGVRIFLNNLQESIKRVYPTALIQLQETGSDIFTSLLKAKQTDNDLILYATDGDCFDEYDSAFQPIYDSGPPAIFLDVRPNGYMYNRLSASMEIHSIPADDQNKTIEAVKTHLSAMTFAPYVLTYHSFEEKKKHQVKVELLETNKSVTQNFEFPAYNDFSTANRIIGLYLEVKIGSKTPIRRVLAGWDNIINRDFKPNRSMTEEVHDMLLGSVDLCFEREGPTLSLQLTEYLRAIMSHRQWHEAVQDGNFETALEQLNKGTFSYPSHFLSMMQPLPNGINNQSATYPEGYRIGVLKIKPALHGKSSDVSFDYLPTSNYMTITKDGVGAFSETIRKTASLALLEHQVFETSAWSSLKNKTLAFNRESSNDERYSTKSLGEKNNYFRLRVFAGSTLKFFDSSTESMAYWMINPTSGELYGVLPDQTGGGQKSTYQQLQELEEVMKGYKDIMAKMGLGLGVTGIGTMPLGIVATYSMTLVKLYALASQALILMNTTGMSEDITLALQELACNVYKEILYDSLYSLGSAMGTIENLIASLGGDFNFFKC